MVIILDFEINECDPNFRVRFTVEALADLSSVGRAADCSILRTK
jgi:hypothetical protein